MDSPEPPNERQKTLLILLLLTLATVAKITWAATSIGTTDTVRFFHFAEALLKQPAAEVYASDPRLNHTMTVMTAVRLLASATKEDAAAFVLWLRVPGILADVAILIELLLLRRLLGLGWGWLAFAAACPMNFIINGFFGNLDGVLAAAMFFACTAALRGSPALSGMWLGLACHVKVVPLLLAPALAAYWLSHGGLKRFLVASGALVAAMVGGGFALAGPTFLKQVFTYGSVWGVWGIPELLVKAGVSQVDIPLRGFKDPVGAVVAPILKAIIVGMAIWFGWRNRRGDGRTLLLTAAATLLIFFTLTPGFGAQYFVWWFAIVLAVSPRCGTALAIAATASIAVSFSAGSAEPFPWHVVILDEALKGWAAWVGPIAWGCFVVGTVAIVRRLFRRADLESLPTSA